MLQRQQSSNPAAQWESNMHRQLTLLIAMLALLAVSSSCSQGGTPDNQAQPGSTIYAENCAGCHGPDGAGGVIAPPLAGNSSLQQAQQTIDRVLEGSGSMPAFADRLSDTQIAAVVSHVRESWGNAFGRVTTAEVAARRTALNLNHR
jgi:mono/diheme cytochrome c family protein